MNIYVGNIDYTVETEALKDLFEQFGEVSMAKIIQDKYTNKSRGFGFVEMPDDIEAKNAIKNLNGEDLGGRALVVREAVSKK